jgi:hypothetical protein
VQKFVFCGWVVPFEDRAWLQNGLSIATCVVDRVTGAEGFFLRVVDGICKNRSGSEKLITCFLINF